MSYFDLTITQIPVGFGSKPEIHSRYGEVFPVFLKPPTVEEWQNAWKSVNGEGQENPVCHIELTDNGPDGDGLLFKICGPLLDMTIAEVFIPDSSIPTLIAALQAIQSLRKSVEGGASRDE